MPRSNSLGVNESIVHAPRSQANANWYRSGLGMFGSAEFQATMDDFTGPVATNVPFGWAAAIIDTGGTTTTSTTAATGANGVLVLADATLSEGAAFYGARGLQLTAGKRAFVEVRFQTDDVTDNAVQFGLTDLTATTNPEDLWTTTAANLVAFGLLDGLATPQMLADKSNSGSTAEAGTISVVASTWTTMAIYYDGVNLFGFVNGNQALKWSQASTTIPTGVALAPFVGHINGNGAGGNVVLFDYIRWSFER
jgi:hypothetical protein